MTLWRFLRVAGVVFVGSMVPASFAAAAPKHYIASSGHVTEVQLRGSNGYQLQVFADYRHVVTVVARRGGLMTEYSVRGTENGKYGVKARLSGLGSVQFRFVPNGRQHRATAPPWCEGPGGWLLEGVVRGRIRFTGEDGYTQVAVKRAKAEVETWPRRRCRVLEPGRGPRKWTASFEAFREVPPNVLFLVKRYAKRFRPSSRRVVFQMYAGFSRGPVHILRTASAAASVSSLVFLDPKSAPENFTVAPPPPFSGTATFQRTPESVFAWEGDLSVQFPGVAPIALAGPAFHASFCALRGCVSQSSSISSDAVITSGAKRAR